MPVVFGANIGTTVTAQLLAFQVEQGRYLLLFGGVLLCFACKGQKGRCAGEALFGFGLLFEGITVMSGALQPLTESPQLWQWLVRVQANPALGLLAGLGMTLTVQSSSATIAMLQTVAAQPGPDGVHGLLSLAGAIPVLLGDNIGTTITAVLASIGQGKDAKRVAAAHAIFNLSGAVVCCGLLGPFAALVQRLSPAGPECAVIARQIANAHTLFNVCCALVWLAHRADGAVGDKAAPGPRGIDKNAAGVWCRQRAPPLRRGISTAATAPLKRPWPSTASGRPTSRGTPPWTMPKSRTRRFCTASRW